MAVADGIIRFLLDRPDEGHDPGEIAILEAPTRTVVVVAFPGDIGDGAQQHHVSPSPGFDDEVDGFEAFFFLVPPRLNPISLASDSM